MNYSLSGGKAKSTGAKIGCIVMNIFLNDSYLYVWT